MVYELSDFIGCELRCRANAPAARVLGFVVDGADWALRYVRVRAVQETGEVTRLLPTAALPPVHEFDGHLTACLTPDEIARGHVLTGACEDLTRGAERALHDALHWQPYWPEPDSAGPCTLHDAARAVGAPLSCCGEAFGRVDDLLVDTETWTVSALCIATDRASDLRRLHLPPSFIREADWLQPSFDSDVRAAALACAPTSPLTVPGRDYFDRLQEHLAGQ